MIEVKLIKEETPIGYIWYYVKIYQDSQWIATPCVTANKEKAERSYEEVIKEKITPAKTTVIKSQTIES